MPRFSIVVPAFNAQSTLDETLDAIAAQSLRDWECVIVDDGSADSTAAIAKSRCDRDQRFRLIRQENMGTAGAYNTGVRAAQAGLIAICSADDLLLSDHLITMSDLVERNPECGIFSSNGEYLHESGERIPVYEGAEWRIEHSLTLDDVLSCCFFSVGAVYRLSVFELVGGYRAEVYGEDYDFWLRAMARGVAHRYTPHVLALHRLSLAQKSSDVLRVWRSNVEVFENLIEAGWVASEQRPMVQAAIESRRRMIAGFEKEQSLKKRFDPLSRSLTAAFGEGPVRRMRSAVGSALRRLRLL